MMKKQDWKGDIKDKSLDKNENPIGDNAEDLNPPKMELGKEKPVKTAAEGI